MTYIKITFLLILLTSCGKYSKPQIELVGHKNERVSLESSYEEKGATATSKKGDDLTANITTTNNINTKVVGDYWVRYDVTDKKGRNAITTTRRVSVQNDAYALFGTYQVLEGNPSVCIDTTTIKASVTVNNEIQVGYLWGQKPMKFMFKDPVLDGPIIDSGSVKIKYHGMIDEQNIRVYQESLNSPGVWHHYFLKRIN
jgi:hypothetical protein